MATARVEANTTPTFITMKRTKPRSLTLSCLLALPLSLTMLGSHISLVEANEISQLIDAFPSDGVETHSPVMGLDGHPITPDSADNGELFWSPEGQQVAFFDTGDLYVTNADGAALRKLFENHTCPAHTFYTLQWLSESEVFMIQTCEAMADSSFPHRFYLINTVGDDETSHIEESWTLDSAISSSLSLSPDGETIAFVKDNDIYTVDRHGRHLTNLTNNPGLYSSGGSPIVWSPDSRQLAFYSGAYPYQQLYIINADGTNLTNLTNDPNNFVYNVDILWSPNSEQIAFYHAEPDDYLGDRQSLYLIDVFSRELINLTPEPGHYGELSWSPDGQQLAFVSGNFNEQDLYTIKPNGQDLTKLTSQSFSSIYLNWSRDSQRIVFTGYSEDGEDRQYVVNRDGSALIDLTQDAHASDGLPNW